MVSNNRHIITKTLFTASMIIVSFLITLIFLNNSWIKIATLCLIVIGGVVWFASHGLLRRVFKYVIVCVLIFALSFTAFEGYLFWNAGYPQTVDNSQGITLSYPNILNASLTEIVQSVKDTPTFRLLMLEYPGEVSIGTTITLDTGFSGGHIEVMVIPVSTNCGFRFWASGGGPYHVTRETFATLLSSSPSQLYSQQTPDNALKQIDSLGFQWFYDQAIDEYKNKTGTTPEINELKITFMWNSQANYEGMVIEMIGSYVVNDRGSGVFFVNFQPDGTLNYLNTTT